MIRVGSGVPYVGIRGRGPRLLDMRQSPRASPVVTFSGVVYLNGTKTEGLNSDGDKPYVRVIVSTGTAEEAIGPPPNPFPADEEWYTKANTYGDIHITRFG